MNGWPRKSSEPVCLTHAVISARVCLQDRVCVLRISLVSLLSLSTALVGALVFTQIRKTQSRSVSSSLAEIGP